MTFSAYIGIDPGASGGLAIIPPIAVPIPRAEKMPPTATDIWNLLGKWKRNCGEGCPVFAVIEQVGGFIGVEGKGVGPGPAMFKFGMSYGGLLMALTGLQIPFETVTPQKWQKVFSLHKDKSDTKTEWKNRLKAKAQQLFPKIEVTLATADALLVAEYCRRKWIGTL